MKKTTQYTAELAAGVRYRVRHEIERNRVLRYVVQLELEEEGAWVPIRRSDSAHGRAHWHIFHRHNKAERFTIPMGFNAALTHAEQEIKNHWREIVRQWQNE
jgi:hypothetical protein